MAYDPNTAQILAFQGYVDDYDFHFTVSGDRTQTTLHWYHADPKPTEQDVLDWRPAWLRDDLNRQINQNRIAADIRHIDLRIDAGRAVLMDEANEQAEAKSRELVGTADADLDAFDITFDPLQIGSIRTAQSLYAQEQETLQKDATLTAQQRSDLEAARDAHAALVAAGDDSAEVPQLPNSVRLKIGIVAEGYGILTCRRIEDGGWWWLEFELETERELSVTDYWIAVYSEGTYLTTPQLTQDTENPNIFRAERLAVNLPHTPPKQYEYTLCHQHISNQQFDPVVLAADANEKIDPIRWGGNATGAAPASTGGGEWQDTGQVVSYVGSNLVRIGSTAGFQVGDILRFNERPQTFTITSVHSSIDLLLDVQPNQNVVGDAVYKQT